MENVFHQTKSNMLSTLAPYLRATLLLFAISFGITSSAQEITVGLLPISIPAKAQKESNLLRGILDLNSRFKNDYNLVKSSQGIMANVFIRDGRFKVIDRSNDNEISNELNRQKSESYMDGYVVEQGKQIGAEYIVKGSYLPNERELHVNVFEVANSRSLGSEVIKLKRNLLGNTKFNEHVDEQVEELMQRVWPVDFVFHEVVEQSKNEIKKALIVSLTSTFLEKEDKLRLVVRSEEEVAGKVLIRNKLLSEAEVDYVENENFYVIKIKKGKKELKKAFDAGQTILVQTIN